MVEIAAHLVDHIFPKVPVRQWVLSLPKRLRYFLVRDHLLANEVRRIFLTQVEKALIACSRDAPKDAKLGGLPFTHRFGFALNQH